jgi:hypothetical protein
VRAYRVDSEHESVAFLFAVMRTLIARHKGLLHDRRSRPPSSELAWWTMTLRQLAKGQIDLYERLGQLLDLPQDDLQETAAAMSRVQDSLLLTLASSADGQGDVARKHLADLSSAVNTMTIADLVREARTEESRKQCMEERREIYSRLWAAYAAVKKAADRNHGRHQSVRVLERVQSFWTAVAIGEKPTLEVSPEQLGLLCAFQVLQDDLMPALIHLRGAAAFDMPVLSNQVLRFLWGRDGGPSRTAQRVLHGSLEKDTRPVRATTPKVDTREVDRLLPELTAQCHAAEELVADVTIVRPLTIKLVQGLPVSTTTTSPEVGAGDTTSIVLTKGSTVRLPRFGPGAWILKRQRVLDW